MRTARLFRQDEMVFVKAEEVRDGKYSRDENFVDPEYQFRVIYAKDCKGHTGPYFRLYLTLDEYEALSTERKTQYDILRDQRHYAESAWHREWEARCSSFCEIEHYVRGQGKTFKRADAYNAEAKTVIEFQHSFIALDFEDRNVFYTQLGLNIVWLYDLTKLEAVAREDGVFEILENNAKGIFRIAGFPQNLCDFPVFIQVKGGTIYRVSALGRKEIEGSKNSTIRTFKPDGVFTEQQFIDGVKQPSGLFLSRSYAELIEPKGQSVFELWNPNFHRMVIRNPKLDLTIMIYAEGKCMNTDLETGCITYCYVTWSDKRGTYYRNGDKFYKLSDAKARSKDWFLLRSYDKNV